MGGYTQKELDRIQGKWGLRFPPDLLSLYRERRSVIPNDDFDWLKTPEEKIRDMIQWPFEGFLFDIRHGLWWPEWGEHPSDDDGAKGKLQQILAKAPKLIPVYGHRYIPEEPHEADNPVFSVWQMDVITYGANLDDYIARENNPISHNLEWPVIKHVEFWSRAVEFNRERFAGGGSFAFFNKGETLPE